MQVSVILLVITVCVKTTNLLMNYNLNIII